jgi:hypothetical protein
MQAEAGSKDLFEGMRVRRPKLHTARRKSRMHVLRAISMCGRTLPDRRGYAARFTAWTNQRMAIGH